MRGFLKIMVVFIVVTILVVGFLFYQTYRTIQMTQRSEVSRTPITENSKIEIEPNDIIIEPIKDKPLLKEENPVPDNFIQPKVELLNSEIFQGETLVLEIFGDVEKLYLGEREILFSNILERKIAVIGFDTREGIGSKPITYKSSTTTKNFYFNILNRDYPITKIVIPEKLAEQGITSSDLIQSITKSDDVTLSEILSQKTNTYNFTGQFVIPLDKWVNVGGFGNVRQDQNGAIRHLGVDLEGNTGDPVYSTNEGVVAYAGVLQNFGNSVVIDHGLGIYSIYLHMSKLIAKTGETVFAGEKIGEVGNTGDYTLEPHLHFSIKVAGVSVNPKNFIEEFNKILK